MSDNKDNYVMVFEAPKIELPEFRLYYDQNTGNVLFYTCEKLEGTYIVVDRITFASARYDIRVIDGRIEYSNPSSVISKLVASDSGKKCLKEDLSIVVNQDTDAEIQYLKLMMISDGMTIII